MFNFVHFLFNFQLCTPSILSLSILQFYLTNLDMNYHDQFYHVCIAFIEKDCILHQKETIKNVVLNLFIKKS